MSLLIQLPEYLTWQSLLYYPIQLKTSYIQMREHLFYFWLNSVKVPSSIKNDFEKLPLESRKRIFMAPAIFNLLISPGLRPIVSIRQMIRAEQFRTTNVYCDKRKKCWTPLGEQEFPSGNTNPFILGNIYLDAYSPWSKMKLEGCQGKESIHSFLEVKTIFNRLEKAINLIYQTNENAGTCFSSMTQTIAIRKDIIDPHSFASSSWDTEPGKIGLTNAHLPQISVECLINALIHESIHTLLYMIEIEEPLYLKIEDKKTLWLKSPWTGNLLTIYSFTHACFVWFALWNFWKLQKSLQSLDNKQVILFFEFAASGFLNDSPLDILTNTKSIFNLDLLNAVSQIQKIVRSS